LTERIIGAAYEVHNQLGSGFLEKVYETALSHELKTRGIDSVTQAEITVCYKGLAVGSYYGDLFVDGEVLCEIKAVERLIPAHEAQLLNYLKATGIKIGLLLNFGSGRLQVRRMAF
jgi:GxxExxY protein